VYTVCTGSVAVRLHSNETVMNVVRIQLFVPRNSYLDLINVLRIASIIKLTAYDDDKISVCYEMHFFLFINNGVL